MGMRNCEIVQQIKYLPGYPDSWKETLEEKLNSNKRIVHWCYIVHDKDTDENGNPKEPHIHLLLVLDDSYESSTIGGYVGGNKILLSPSRLIPLRSAQNPHNCWVFETIYHPSCVLLGRPLHSKSCIKIVVVCRRIFL